MYLTPERFRTLGLGSDLSGLDEFELQSILQRASDLVDSYCSVPLLPRKHDFRGGTITGEAHTWSDSGRFYPWHAPVKTVDSMRVYATNNVYVELGGDDLFIDISGGYVEIVALAVSPIGFFGATGLVSLRNPVAQLDYTYGWEFTEVGDYLEPTDAREYRSEHQFWTADPAPIIYVNAVEQTTGFTINREEGTVVFDDPLTTADIVTADYTHPLPSEISQATGLIAASLISDRELITKGLGNLAEIQVEEVRLRRDSGRTGTFVVANAIPDSAKALLSGFQHVTVM